jgi:hypothetical protein
MAKALDGPMSSSRPDPTEIARIFAAKKDWHRRQAALSPVEKVRILLRLQHEDLPLIRRHRTLEPWERPWDIKP